MKLLSHSFQSHIGNDLQTYKWYKLCVQRQTRLLLRLSLFIWIVFQQIYERL